MIDSIATVIALEGDYAVVRVGGLSCGDCREKSGCDAYNLARLFCSDKQTFRLRHSGGLSLGDRVTVLIPEGSLWRASLMAYGLPLLFLFAGTWAGERLGGEPLSIVMALLGALLAYACLKWLSPLLSGARPVIKERALPEGRSLGAQADTPGMDGFCQSVSVSPETPGARQDAALSAPSCPARSAD